MKKEEIIKKWLLGEASDEDIRFLRETGELEVLERIDDGLKKFKAPTYDVESELERTSSFVLKKSGRQVFWQPLLRVAAVITLLVSAYFLFIRDPSVTVTTVAGETNSLYLPDSSHVELNASSMIVYNPGQWDDQRFLHLEGEAFFKVKPGSTFDVATSYGTVRVVGTAFNIRSRQNYFEVICAEGKVAVLQDDQTNELTAGKRLRIMEDAVIVDQVEGYSTFLADEPYSESRFESVPFGEVLSELERQFNISIERGNINETILFTGTFTHQDLDVALKTVFLPLNLNYQLQDNKVILEESAPR